jgi:UDP-N-acetylglucosamine--dolichyl-phosphate N-acetylglucosaminephosphotransferase
MTFLGFVDDVLDLKWRYKLIVPLFAALPIVLSHTGNTSLTIPTFLSHSLHLPATLELGFFYHLYTILMAIFCSNSINIYAG